MASDVGSSFMNALYTHSLTNEENVPLSQQFEKQGANRYDHDEGHANLAPTGSGGVGGKRVLMVKHRSRKSDSHPSSVNAWPTVQTNC